MVIDGLVAHTTPIVGRSAELAEIRHLFDDPTCRLLTLLGPGGIGKTRLAVHAVARLASQYVDGCFVVSCAPINSADLIIPAIAEAVGLSIFGTTDPTQQLAAYLRDKRLLLVVDNFDHLADHAHLLGIISHAAPAVHMLVTSRERLGLAGEVILTIRGLSVDGAGQPSDAARLFRLAVQRVDPDFDLLEAETPAVDRICQLVEGMPLALELAASWARVMSLPEIADEIAHNLGILADRRRDLPDRHLSMRAAFDYSWSRLTTEEQRVFTHLSIFRGAFSREAAEKVAGASLPVIALLVDKSLVRYQPQRGFDLHELLRQYGEEKLREDPAECERLEDAHSTYYADWIGDLEAVMHRGSDIEISEVLEPYFRNIQAGWRRAVEHGTARQIGPYALPLSHYCGMRGLWRYGRDEFLAAIRHLRTLPASPERDHALARALTHGGWFLQQLLAAPEALPLLEEGLAILRRLDDSPAQDTVVALCFYGLALRGTGDLASARRSMEEGFAVAVSLGEAGVFSQAFVLVYLAETALMQGDFTSARDYAGQGLAVSRSAGVEAGRSISPSHLVLAQLALGNTAAACASLRHDVDWDPRLAYQLAPLALILIAASAALAQIGEPVYAAEVLSAAMNLPLGDREFYARFGPAQAVLADLEKRLSPETLAAAMERGKAPVLTRVESDVLPHLRPEFVERLLAALDSAISEPRSRNQLTGREMDVLRCLARGMRNEEIASELVISIGTTKRHIHHISTKLKARNRTQAVARARELGIL